MPGSWASFLPEGPSRASPPPSWLLTFQAALDPRGSTRPMGQGWRVPSLQCGNHSSGGQWDGVCALLLQPEEPEPALSTGTTEPQGQLLQSTAPKVPQRVNRHKPCAALPWQEHCSEPEMMHSRTLKSICYTQLCWARLQAAQCLV